MGEEPYRQAEPSASHPTLEAGAAHRGSGAEDQSARTDAAAQEAREVSSQF